MIFPFLKKLNVDLDFAGLVLLLCLNLVFILIVLYFSYSNLSYERNIIE